MALRGWEVNLQMSIRMVVRNLGKSLKSLFLWWVVLAFLQTKGNEKKNRERRELACALQGSFGHAAEIERVQKGTPRKGKAQKTLKTAGVLRSKDCLLHFALRFPIFQAFFCWSLFLIKSDCFFEKPPVLQNRGPPKTKAGTPLWFFNGAQNLWLYLFLKHMSENGQKRSPVKTREFFLMSWNALKRSVLRPLSKT